MFVGVNTETNNVNVQDHSGILTDYRKLFTFMLQIVGIRENCTRQSQAK